MTDRRLLATNGRVAAAALKGQVTAERFVTGTAQIIVAEVTDICTTPAGPRDRQLLRGATITQLEDRDGWSFIQSGDGYVGYIRSAHCADATAPTHFIATQATHAYTAEDFKSPDVMSLPFGARVTVMDERRKFYETDAGFIPKSHLRSIDRPFTDPATVAQMHFGVPYLWGGNSTRGIDCSGLVAAGLTACATDCPADSDLQMAALGTDATGPYQRGDIVFWKGHVGMMVDADTMIHANAHHMATAYEPIARAILRIKAQGDGDMLAHRRL